MNLIGSFFAWLMPAIVGWAVSFFGRKVIVATSVIASFILVTAAFVVCIRQIILTVMELAIIPEWVSHGMGLFLPFSFDAMLASILSAQTCRWAYDKAVEKIKFLASAS